MRNPLASLPARCFVAVLAPAIAVLAAATGVFAASSPRAIVAYPNHDFGTVSQGVKVVHAFVVRNEGTAPLQILGAELSMPGMRVRFRPEVLPGAEGTITIEWTTDQVQGETEGVALVRLDDPATPEITLTLRGIVKPPLEFQPLPAVFLSVFPGEARSADLTIVNNAERAIALTIVENEGTHYIAWLLSKDVGRRFGLTVKVRPGVPTGRYDEELTFQTDDPARPTVKIPVHLLVKADLYANPDTVDFGELRLQDLTSSPGLVELAAQTFLVKRREGGFSLRSVSCDIPALRIEVTPQEGESDTFRIDVTPDLALLGRGKLSGTIRIATSDPRFPEIVVPVVGEVR